MQKLDNIVYRTIQEVPLYIASSALRGEIGASSSKERDMKNKLSFIRRIMDEHGNDLLRNILLNHYYEKETKFMKRVEEYMKIININLDKLKNTTIRKIKEIINTWNTNSRKKDLEEKSTLRIYSKYKNDISDIKWYDNTVKTNILIKATTDKLKLNWREKYKGKETTCLCGHEIEDLEDFFTRV